MFEPIGDTTPLAFDRFIGADLSLHAEGLERCHIEQTLARVEGRVEDAAAILGLRRSTLYARMKKHGLRSPK